MASITDIEQEVLLQIGENLTTADNWDGTDILRDGLVDAIDELCMAGHFFVEKVSLKLKADIAFYSYSMPNHWPFYVKKAWLVEQNRELDAETLTGLMKENEKWLIGRSSPYKYVPYSPETIIIWPCYSNDGGLLELDVVCTPKAYSSNDLYLTLSEKMEEALLEYGKYCLLMQTGRLDDAMDCFGKYLEISGAVDELKNHKEAMQERTMENAYQRDDHRHS